MDRENMDRENMDRKSVDRKSVDRDRIKTGKEDENMIRAGAEKLSIYIHIPFCVRKCLYCDFLSFASDERTKERYVAALIKEISTESEKYESYEIDSVFFGGGTPSILATEMISDIMKCIYENFQVDENAEISIEVNPGTADAEKFIEYRKAGINRISIGLQSSKNEELKLLGRIHTWEQFLNCYNSAKESGFDNINIDLMSGLPGQKVEDYLDTLKNVVKLKPNHISAYSLIIEEGTEFWTRYGEDNNHKQEFGQIKKLPSEEEDRQMYHLTEQVLKENGYERYEISNYAKAGYECKHNIGYWTRHNYVGFGLGAASLVNNVRWKNISSLENYLSCIENMSKGMAENNIREEIAILSEKEQIEEFMFLGLRLTRGINKGLFEMNFGKKIEDVYPEVLANMTKQGLLNNSERNLFLTEKGLDLANVVMAEFLID